jgi:hypothetical protein
MAQDVQLNASTIRQVDAFRCEYELRTLRDTALRHDGSCSKFLILRVRQARLDASG